MENFTSFSFKFQTYLVSFVACLYVGFLNNEASVAGESSFKLPFGLSYIGLFFIRVASGYCRSINYAGSYAFIR